MGTFRAGIDLGATKIQTVVVGPDHAVVGQARRPTPTEGGPPDVAAEIAAAVEEAAESAGVAVEELAGAGVGSPGAVDQEAGTVAHARNLPNWEEPYPLAATLADALDAPVRIDNDVQVAVLGELELGPEQAVGRAGAEHRRLHEFRLRLGHAARLGEREPLDLAAMRLHRRRGTLLAERLDVLAALGRIDRHGAQVQQVRHPCPRP